MMRRATLGALVPACALAAATPGAARAQPACPAAEATAPTLPLAPPLDRVVPGRASAAAVPLRTALDQLAAAAGVRLSYSRELLPLDRPSCPPAGRAPLGVALARLLAGTGVQPVAVGGDQVVLAPALDAVDAADAGPAPPPRVAMLEQVVVTGSATAGPARRLPFAVDVVEGGALGGAGGAGTSALANPGLAGALNGRVPGLWLWAQPPTALLARYGSLRGASSFGVSTPKLYLDGVELANPLVVTELPADRIARVEVIRGPQGAALYGADAISGVINIVTRHDGATDGAARGRTLLARGGVGGAGTDFVGRPAVTQDYALLLRAGTGARTGGVSLSATSLGAYAPGAASRRLTATADFRRVSATGTAAATLRVADAATDAPANPLLTAVYETPPDATTGPGPGSRLARSRSAIRGDAADRGPDSSCDTYGTAASLAGADAPPQRLQQVTGGVTLTRSAGGRWTHALTAGVDAYRLAGVATDILPIPSPLDSAQRAARGGAARGTLRASSTATFALRPGVRATLLGLADYGLLRDATSDGMLLVRGCGTSTGAATSRGPGTGRPGPSGYEPGASLLGGGQSAAYLSTAGVVGQATLALRDALFLTAGLRGERNDGFTRASHLAALPSVGASYVHGLGTAAAVKLRVAYGSGIRPARTATRAAAWRGAGRVGADLAPEEQRGLEAGADLYVDAARLGRAPATLGLHVTRFDQRASNLLQQVLVDRPTLWSPGSTGQAVPGRRAPTALPWALQTLGAIDNQGWELSGDLRAGPLTLAATYALVDSRVRRIADGYGGDLRVGDRMLEVPRHTAGLSAAWQLRGWSASLGAARASNWINYDRLALATRVSESRAPITGPQLRGYWRQYGGVTRLEASAARDLRRGLSVVLTGANLLDRQQGEPDNVTVVPGRTITAGVRARF